MSNPTFLPKIVATQSADVATNGTITLSYPATYSSSNVKATGAKLWSSGLATLLSQTSGQFSVAYGGSIVITYLGSTTIPAGTNLEFFLPVPDAEDALTDSTTGTASQTLAAVTNPDLSAWNGSTDPSAAQATAINAAITSLKNAVASLAAKQAAMQTAIKNANLNPV